MQWFYVLTAICVLRGCGEMNKQFDSTLDAEAVFLVLKSSAGGTWDINQGIMLETSSGLGSLMAMKCHE